MKHMPIPKRLVRNVSPKPQNVVLIARWHVSGMQVMRSLTALGATVYLVIDRKTKPLKWSTKAKLLWQNHDLFSVCPMDIAQRINVFHDTHGVSWIMGADLESMLLIESMRHVLKPHIYPQADPSTLTTLNDKWLFYRLCQKNKVPVPKTLQIYPAKFNLRRIQEEIGYPLIIKPVGMYGKKDVWLINDYKELQRRFPIYPHAAALAQEFIPGKDWGCSIFALDGNITHWATFECTSAIGMQCKPQPQLLDAVRDIVTATKYTGVANFDARLDERDGSMKFFECNPRFFARLSACRYLGLDFVEAGLGSKPTKLVKGVYHNWREFTHNKPNLKWCDGQWSAQTLYKELKEVFSDPLPALVKRWHLLLHGPDRYERPGIVYVDGQRSERTNTKVLQDS